MSRKSLTTLISALALSAALLLTACGSEQAASPAASPTAGSLTVSSDMLTEVEAGFAAGIPGTPTTNPADCPALTGQNQDMTVHTPCVIDLTGDWRSVQVRMTASGFKPGEAVNTELKDPNGETNQKFNDISKANANGKLLLQQSQNFPDAWNLTGQYTQIVEGRESGHKAIGNFYFKASAKP